MNLNEINANVNRLLQNIWAVITFLKEFCVDSAKDVSITYINANGSESVKTFPNIAKQINSLEFWKQNAKVEIKSAPKFITSKIYKDADFGDFTNWVKPCTVEEILTINTDVEWNKRTNVEKEWLTAMGREGLRYFYPLSFKVYRLTAPASREGYSFPYITVPVFAENNLTIAAFVRYVQGALPTYFWCSGLTKSGKIELCGQKVKDLAHGSINCHPYKAVANVDTVIEVALAGVVDTDVDLSDPKNWWGFTGKIIY